MNISQAKIQVKNAITVYMEKDEHGRYLIPIERQRPVFLMGPPGIGKTAIMQQIAQEMGIGLVSYSMTHHTRQSALGLPYIKSKYYNGEEYSVSEYTMSEIIATVYDTIEESGVQEGILFLDEINCVSETLAPAMLQFLQYKTFGRHKIPNGWIVVTAGNPPEYNNSVREFDIVTWDRLKRVNIEPDYSAWKEYALCSGVHPAIITYLDIRKEEFYSIEQGMNGKKFVTARGWSDLSDIISLYEQKNIIVDESLIEQYLQNAKIAKEFAVYYDLFNKYKSDYQIDKILAGIPSAKIIQRASDATFDERISILGMIFDALLSDIRSSQINESIIQEMLEALKLIKRECTDDASSITDSIQNIIELARESIKKGQLSSSLSNDTEHTKLKLIESFINYGSEIKARNVKSSHDALVILKQEFDKNVATYKHNIEIIKNKLTAAISFLEKAFGDGNEILIFITELTANPYCASFIGKYGCDKYFAHNKELLFYERQKQIIASINHEIDWEP